ncbi:MAG: hypothetical protein IJO67_04390, partial [Clostridia bacterium]|nr:hypothetical protein [Clostridia bacterium]
VLVLPDQQVKLIPELTVVLSSFSVSFSRFAARSIGFPFGSLLEACLMIISPYFRLVNPFFQIFFNLFCKKTGKTAIFPVFC